MTTHTATGNGHALPFMGAPDNKVSPQGARREAKRAAQAAGGTGGGTAAGPAGAKPVRVQLSRAKGYRLQQASLSLNGLPAVNVARPTNWGNPFIIGEEYVRHKMQPGGGQESNTVADHDHAVRLYKRFTARETHIQIAAYQMLRGKNLACWCALDEPCHADVLREIANARSSSPEGGSANKHG